MSANSVLNRTSRYVSGGTTEISDTAIEWFERTSIPFAADDTVFVITESLQGRLDMVAKIFLDDPKLWWVIAMHNNILDVNFEVSTGVIISIPSKERVNALLSGKVGGVPSTRVLRPGVQPIV